MKELLIKYINGNCTDEEKIRIANWLDASPQNMKEYMTLRRLNDMMIWQYPLSPSSQKPQSAPRLAWKRIYTEGAKIAAIFILAILTFKYVAPDLLTPKPRTTMQTLHVPAGQRAEVTLEDGTRIWLNAQTTLSFPNHFSSQQRQVSMDGEGYFNVTPDSSRPFIVETKKYHVKVLGTIFNLMAYPDDSYFETSLLKGAVEVLTPGQTNGVLLKPDECLSIEDEKIHISPISNKDRFLWKDGIISFDNVTFNQLFKRLELYFDKKIEIRNSEVLSFHCTGKFRTKDGVEHILKVLQLKNKFSYQVDDQRNTITIE